MRKQADDAFEENDARFRLLVEESPFGIQIFDPDGTLVQVNKAWETMWNIRAEEVVGRYNALYDPQLVALGLMPFVERAFAGEKVMIHDMWYDPAAYNAPGRARWIRSHCYHIRDEDGQIQQVVLLSEDVTEQKKAQEKVRWSEARYRALVEQINDVLFTLDDNGTFTYVSPVIETVSGFTPGDILGKPFSDFVHPDDVETLRHSFQYTLSGTQKPSEFRIITKDGAVRHVRTSSRPIYEDGVLLGLRGVLVDITERKKHEAEREELIDELETKNSELERFTYTVSHDLKSPLVTIKGFLGLLEQDALNGNVAQMKQDIEHIKGATDKMSRLLDELLELSRIGRLTNPSIRVSLTDLAHDALTLVAGTVATRHITIDIAPDMPAVLGDRLRLIEVFQNLLENAVKFMGLQGDPHIEVGARQEEAMVICYVRDNGMGIAPRYHTRIFDLFERLHQHTEGTGIGLTLVKRIVKLHGGQTWVVSEGEGHGSTFFFSLPPAQVELEEG